MPYRLQNIWRVRGYCDNAGGNDFAAQKKIGLTAKAQRSEEKFFVTLWEINLCKGLILQRSKNPLDKRRDEQV